MTKHQYGQAQLLLTCCLLEDSRKLCLWLLLCTTSQPQGATRLSLQHQKHPQAPCSSWLSSHSQGLQGEVGDALCDFRRCKTRQGEDWKRASWIKLLESGLQKISLKPNGHESRENLALRCKTLPLNPIITNKEDASLSRKEVVEDVESDRCRGKAVLRNGREQKESLF